ncbi:MAG: TatD family hydrolase [Gammaproteobacteria bacterium]|nr:TatD family hydrolase [Gammaproteobacteria bacterium]
MPDKQKLSGLIDIGANLAHDSFDADRDKVLERARRAGVEKIVITGASEYGSEQALALAKTSPQLFATAGVHPHDASQFSENTLAHLAKLAADKKTVAMGECGLDFYRDFSPRPQQEHCLAKQLELACKIGKPVFLHQRDAHDRFIKILEPFLKDLNKVVVHCFTGEQDELDACLELGCYIGITGWICDERRGRHLLESVPTIPADRLMIETDAPYLLPRNLNPKPKSRRNEPCYLPAVVEKIAEATGKPVTQIAEETTKTAKAFFGI